MKNKILIGSIIAVIVLIGVSFTSGVGYNSVTSDVMLGCIKKSTCSEKIL